MALSPSLRHCLESRRPTPEAPTTTQRQWLQARCAPGWDPRWWFDGRNYLESLSPSERAASRRMHDAASVAAENITSEFTHAHRIADRAVAFIEENRDRDFLLVVSIDEPHHPFIAPEPWVSAFEEFELELPNADDSLATKPRQQREWAAHVAAGVPASVMYDEVARVPLLVRWPGRAPAGRQTSALASHLDLAPTLLEFFGVAVPPLLPGKSLLPVCEQPSTASVNAHVFIEFNRFEVDYDGFGAFAPIRAVTDGRWKLALNLLDTDELYDLANDPHEWVNRIDDPDTATVRDALHDVLLARMGGTRDPLRGPHWGRRAWRDLGGSTWGGPTRPRPRDPAFYPPTLLYDTAEPTQRAVYEKT